MSRREVSLAIIGAGPAGLNAAAQAAKLGIDTVVFDLHEQGGGHYFNLPPLEIQNNEPGNECEEGYSQIEQAQKAGAEIITGVEVWGIYPEDCFRICFSGGERKEIWAKKIILAPGAIERTWPFPGWTLPGVMTAGGALTMLKKQKVLPGRRVLISGTGPLQLSLAAKLAEHGVDIPALLELHSRGSLFSQWGSLTALFSQSQRIREGIDYFRTIQSKKIPYMFGWSVIRAIGEKEVSGALIAQVDAKGRPVPGSQKTIEVDCICLGYGLLPDTQFTRLLECSHIMHPYLRTWVPVRDEWLQTSFPGVFAIGDAAEITGKTAAILEGKIASLAVASQLNRLKMEEVRDFARPIQNQLTNERRFAQLQYHAFNLPEDPCPLADPDTVICRCECVTLAQIEEAIGDGATSVQAAKYLSRAGMGWCRGTHCAPIISQMIARQGNIAIEEASQSCIRPPLFPVSLEEALDTEELA